MPAQYTARQPSRVAKHALIGGAATLIVRKVNAGEGAQLQRAAAAPGGADR